MKVDGNSKDPEGTNEGGKDGENKNIKIVWKNTKTKDVSSK